jgi:AcrR family transcriptional regulator
VSAAPARDVLADDVLRHFIATGRVDDSLRAIARALGISHSLLVYHFRTHDALLDAIRDACEQRERDHLASLRREDAAPVDVMRAMWDHLAEPRMWPLYRVRFALDARRPPRDDDDLDLWTAALTPLVLATGVPSEAAEPEAVLWVAVCRGLLWLLVTGHPPTAVDTAADRFFARYRS